MEKYFVKKIEDKLMLVSRDIQVEGKIVTVRVTRAKIKDFADRDRPKWWNNHIGETFKCKVKKDAWYLIDRAAMIHFDCGEVVGKEPKVIGEISPDAVWVKEGDEFNYPLECTHPLPLKDGRYCMIKGPCGHFH